MTWVCCCPSKTPKIEAEYTPTRVPENSERRKKRKKTSTFSIYIKSRVDGLHKDECHMVRHFFIFAIEGNDLQTDNTLWPSRICVSATHANDLCTLKSKRTWTYAQVSNATINHQMTFDCYKFIPELPVSHALLNSLWKPFPSPIFQSWVNIWI